MPDRKQIHIALDCRYAQSHFPGIGRYVYNLAAGFTELTEPSFQLSLIYNASNTSYDFAKLVASSGKHIEIISTKIKPFSPTEQWQLPLLAKRHRFTLWHAPYYIRPYLMPCPVILTAYDLIGKIVQGALPGKKARLAFELTTRLAFRSSQRIITLSHSAAEDITRLYKVNPEKLRVIAPGIEPKFQPLNKNEAARLRHQMQLPEQYVLFIGTNKPHKNLNRLLEAFTLYLQRHPESSIQLVLAGREDPRYSPEIRAKVGKLGLTGRVVFMGNISDTQLVTLYNCATLYIQPSLYEGFGLPILEAQACGLPVICSNRGSLAEAAGEHVPLFDPYNPLDIVNKIELMLNDTVLMLQMRELGLARIAEFSLKKAAEATLKIYNEV
ncbi:glycosyltransferase family 1 protein [Candidatus Chlorohelix sp.]|uniref:glycosyltransferase family 4 protein n=1 Tax=Candidatus Chlorohelix sp. TaxID=3139201 RepID=UPI0030407FF5